VAAVIGILAATIAYATFRLSARANKSQADASKAVVDAQAYERAKVLYESMIKTVKDEADHLRVQVGRLESTVDDLQTANTALTHTIAEAQGEVSKLRREVRSLQTSNRALTAEVAELKAAS
jgi:chromosome segregation ATPase